MELAAHHNEGPLQLRIIAERQDISVKYLEQLMAILKTGGFIRSIRGAKGGYILADEPKKIKLDGVFKCLEGTSAAVDCLDDKGSCSRASDCVTRQVWQKLQDAVDSVLCSLTMQDLADRASQKSAVNYEI